MAFGDESRDRDKLVLPDRIRRNRRRLTEHRSADFPQKRIYTYDEYNTNLTEAINQPDVATLDDLLRVLGEEKESGRVSYPHLDSDIQILKKLVLLQPDQIKKLLPLIGDKELKERMFQILERQHLKASWEGLQAEAPFEDVVDSEGNTRERYSFKDSKGKTVQVVFYSPNELPDLQAELAGKQGFVIGEKPEYRKDEEWQGFVESVRSASRDNTSPLNPYLTVEQRARSEEKAVYFVEATPRSIMDLLTKLGFGSKSTFEMRNQAKDGVITPELSSLLEMILAAKLYDGQGDRIQTKNYAGEALFILAMSGNEVARQELIARYQKAKSQDEDRKKKEVDDTQDELAEQVEPLDPKQLAVVHTTRYLPEETGEEMAMQSSFDGSGWKIPRDTIHFSLNHAVEGHELGSWEDVPYVVIAPLDKMIEQNGNPAVLNTVDTFFEVSPGSKLKLPEETAVVLPGKVPAGDLFVSEEGRVHYRAEDFTPVEIKKIQSALGERGERGIDSSVWRLMMPNQQENDGHLFWDTKITITEEQNQQLMEALGDMFDPRRFMEEFAEKGIETVIQSIFDQTSIPEEQKNILVANVIKKIKAMFVSISKRLAVNATLQAKGYVVQPGGKWAWGDSSTATSRTRALGKQLGVPVTAHMNHISHDAQEEIFGGFGKRGAVPSLINGDLSPKQYRDHMYNFVDGKAAQISPELIKMLYLMGYV